MRVAVTGSHFTGKTSVLEELARLLPDYQLLPEPYYQLAEEGHLFHSSPALEDFEMQLVRALENLADSEPKTLFDRCPIDLLAYLLCHPESKRFGLRNWSAEIQAALAKLDLIFYLPIEVPERIQSASSQDQEFRFAVDERLRELLFGDRCGWELSVIEIQGDLGSRVRQILACLQETTKKPLPESKL